MSRCISVGPLFPIIRRDADDILTVADEELVQCMRFCAERMKLAVEPAASLGLAALQTGAYKPRADEKVCLVICGANLDPATLA